MPGSGERCLLADLADRRLVRARTPVDRRYPHHPARICPQAGGRLWPMELAHGEYVAAVSLAAAGDDLANSVPAGAARRCRHPAAGAAARAIEQPVPPGG